MINHGCKIGINDPWGPHNEKSLLEHLDKCFKYKADLVVLTDNVYLVIKLLQK
ncbi:hypothetical protein FACS189459_6470 [Bacilli bacterium]|nr:hypothetical protein FACS189459_6470 [Bacilli bacterium]